jgi:error-prone DNA polymerase
MARYAELEITTNFSFLRGGSHPEELVATARALGIEAIAVTDRNTLAGVVRAHLAAREVGGIKFIVGARLDLQDAPSLLAYPRDRAAYGRLCRLLTLGQMRAEKGQCTLFLEEVAAHAEGLIFIALRPDNLSTPNGVSPKSKNLITFPPHPSRHATCAELRSRKIAAESPLPNGERKVRSAAASPTSSPQRGVGGGPPRF